MLNRARLWPLAGMLALALAAAVAGCSTTLEAEPPASSSSLDDDEPESDGPAPDESDDGEDPTGPTVPVCDPSTPTERELDPGDGNALVSPARARAAILAGDGSLAVVPIVPHEFFNYYTLAYETAPAGEVTVAAELYVADYEPSGEWLLQIGVTGPLLDPAARPPGNFSIVLDTSSALEDGEFELVRSSAKALISRFAPGDRVSIVTLADPVPALVEAHEVEQADDPVLLDAIDALPYAGEPALELALETAYDLAQSGFAPASINRVVYIGSDLDHIEVIPTEFVASQVGMPGEVGIHLVGAGVGNPGNYDGRLVDELTAAGRGTSLFIADADEGWRAFAERFMSTMAIAARDVSVRVELPPGFRSAGADEAAGAAEPDLEPAFEDLAANRSLVFHERLETCAPEVLDATSRLRVHSSWMDPVAEVAHESVLELGFAEALEAAPARLHKGRAIAAYADALIEWQRAADPATQSQAIAHAEQIVQLALALAPDDPQLAEIAELLALLAD